MVFRLYARNPPHVLDQVNQVPCFCVRMFEFLYIFLLILFAAYVIFLWHVVEKFQLNWFLSCISVHH